MTLADVKNKLVLIFDPDDLVDLLQLDSADIVERFSDFIEDDLEHYAEVVANYDFSDGFEGEEA